MNAKHKEKGKDKKSRLILIIEGIVVLAVVVFLIVFAIVRSSGDIVNSKRAVEINGEMFSVADVNYFYYSYYDYFTELNETYLPYMFDETVSLKKQDYDDDISWFDYFLDETIDTMTSTVLVASEAEGNGYQLNEVSEAEIQDYLDGITLIAENNDTSADQYLEGIYGEGMTPGRYEELMRLSFLSNEYADVVLESFDYTEDELKKYYEENINNFSSVSYERLYFMASDYGTDPTDEELEEAEEQAEEALAQVEKNENLEKIASEYNAAYFSADDAYYSTGYPYADWLFDEKRKEGDCTIIGDGNGYYVIVFWDRDNHNYSTVDIRDIFFEADINSLDSSEDNYSSQVNEMYEESCLSAEEARDSWLEGGAGEKLFAELADTYNSADKPDGGLYQYLLKDTFDTAIDTWCFDEERQPGDYEIIYTEDGFHFVYFVKKDKPAWEIEVRNDLKEIDLEAWYEGLLQTVDVKRYDRALNTVADALA